MHPFVPYELADVHGQELREEFARLATCSRPPTQARSQLPRPSRAAPGARMLARRGRPEDAPRRRPLNSVRRLSRASG
jgi:hypothetical protein